MASPLVSAPSTLLIGCSSGAALTGQCHSESLVHREFLLVSLKLVSQKATLKEGLFWLTVSEAVLLRKEVWQSRTEQVIWWWAREQRKNA